MQRIRCARDPHEHCERTRLRLGRAAGMGRQGTYLSMRMCGRGRGKGGVVCRESGGARRWKATEMRCGPRSGYAPLLLRIRHMGDESLCTPFTSHQPLPRSTPRLYLDGLRVHCGFRIVWATEIAPAPDRRCATALILDAGEAGWGHAAAQGLLPWAARDRPGPSRGGCKHRG